jgi:hypothetical protein
MALLSWGKILRACLETFEKIPAIYGIKIYKLISYGIGRLFELKSSVEFGVWIDYPDMGRSRINLRE